MRKAIGLADGGGDNATNTIGASDGGMAGTISLGTVLIRPVGLSPSIGMAPGENWFRANDWPPENTEPPSPLPPAPWLPNAPRHFTPVTFPAGPGNPFQVSLPPAAWDPVYYQIVLLTEFTQFWVPGALTATLDAILATALLPANRLAEHRNLIEMIEFRDGLQSEVLAQMNTFDAYFQGALGYSPSTHPSTNYLVQGAMRAAEFAAMYYKNQYQRPRPSRVVPQLLPPVAVPGHASYPSAHATQAHTIALVLQAVAAAVVPSVVDITNRMAQRIARGREVLGLHYPSDSAAGERLATDVANALMAGPTIGRLVAAAGAEWAAYTV
jgi:membrane-associated phospholipid phosphatase